MRRKNPPNKQTKKSIQEFKTSLDISLQRREGSVQSPISRGGKMGIVLWKWEYIEPFLSGAITFSILHSVLWVLVRGKQASEQGLVLPSAVLRLIYSRIVSR